MSKVEFIDCEGCGKKLEDSYRERAIVLFADKEFKICPGRRRDYACEPSAACHQKLLRKLSDTCCGCGEGSAPYAGQVCADCKKAIARSREVDKPVQWVGLDPYYFFTRNYLSNSEAALEAVQLLARAVKGARRLTDDCDGSVIKLGGDHPKVYVEADEDQLEALRQLQMTLARVGDDLQRDGVKRGTDLLGRLARGDVKPDDFEQWESKNKPMTEFRSLLLEYKERGLSDEELMRELGATSTNLHYWRQGEYEPSRVLQERTVAFIVEKIHESRRPKPMSSKPIPLALETFLAQFPDNAESWAQATDELPDMYRWISKNGERFPPVGRENCRTPAEWNQKYKAAIREHFNDLSDVEKDELFKTFEQWFE